jgi:L,D-peptidoglycan transpeptidase YkuD (ErfK/YbiS/YcfS/YnhG family)
MASTAPVATPTALPAIAPPTVVARTPPAVVVATPTHAVTAPPTPAPSPPLLVTQLASVGNATQVITVSSSSWSTSFATVQAFEKDAAGWHLVFGPVQAIIGRAGFSSNRTEGDNTTPTGDFHFGTMFGQQPNPGVKFPYRQPDAQSVWVSDSTSPFYNTWQENAALEGEHLASSAYSVPYAYAAAIDYNTSPAIPYKGSAIFLHVSTGQATAGCVSIPKANLLEILRWLDPAQSPLIVMGPTSVIRQY